MPYPLPLTRTEAYLAYKAGVIQQSDLKPSLAVPRNGIDAWLAYWTGLAADYPKREDGTPHILQEEEAYIAYLCGVINEYPEKCLRRVGAYLRYLISARWGRPDHPLNREELYLSLLKTQVIPSGDPSSDIEIHGTAKAPFVDLKMYGNTFQQSYTGKNLYYDTGGYAQGFVGDDGKVSPSTNSVTNATYIKASENTQYVMSFSTIGIGAALRGVGCYDSNKDFIERIPATAITNGSFQTVADTAYIRVYFYNANGLDATNFPTNYISDIQLELGSTPTSGYEPYVGGVPSPNPDYPQQVQTVTGTQTVTINGTDYPIDLGSIELCKLGDYQDYIWKDGEDWKVHKAIGHESRNVTISGLNNSASISSGVTSHGTFQFYKNEWGNTYDTTAGVAIASTNIGIYQSQSLPGNIAANSMADGTFCQRSGTNDRVYFRFASWAGVKTIEEVQTMLNNAGGVNIWYPLATPTDTTITDTNLISQLNALLNGGAENGTTYIKVNATDPNLPGLLVVEAPKYE